MLPRFGRPTVAVSTHTHTNRCGAEYVSSRLHPTFNGCKGFADQVLLRAYTCVLQKSGPEPEVEILSRLRREHTHVPCRLGHLRVAPEGQGLQGLQGFARLLRAYICVLQNKLNQGCTKGTKYYKASADQVLLQAYMCVLQNDKTQGFTQGSTDTQRFGRPPAAAGTHVRCRIDQCRAAPGVKVYEGVADPILLGIQGCTQGSKVTEVWLTSCCCEHTCVLQGQGVLLSGHTL